jgi:hypothetical protein
MRLAQRFGFSLEEMERLTATELSLWLELDKPVEQKPPTSINDFFAKVRR